MEKSAQNQQIASIFYEMAELMELHSENRFKIIAYSRAARTIESLKEDISRISGEGRLESIPGIGKAIAQKIREFLETGRIEAHQNLLQNTPQGLAELLQIQGLGPKTVSLLHEKLNITNIDLLEKAAKEHRIRRLPGMGPTKENNILKALERYRKRSGRILYSIAEPIVDNIISNLQEIGGLKNITPAGSFRRRKETVGDIDILATAERPEDIVAAFVKMPIVDEVLVRGPTKASIIVQETIQVDLRIVPHRSFGTVLQYFTGSKEHNVSMRRLAQDQGYSLSEYSLERMMDKNELYFDSEKEVYEALGLEYIPPELREDRGEIEAAKHRKLPKLVDSKDIRGDLHVHSDWSDGKASIEEMALAAFNRGYEYIGIADHSPSLTIAGGLAPDRLEQKIKAIEELNERLERITVLIGTEVNIKADGKLDYPDNLLKKCDIVIASIHSSQMQNTREMTAKLILAMENEFVDVIGHPTGRLIDHREPYQFDTESVLEAAKRTETALEINAHPRRLDINDTLARAAKEMGVMICINSDAHETESLQFMKYGLNVARRGWLEKDDILNTRDLKNLQKMLKH